MRHTPAVLMSWIWGNQTVCQAHAINATNINCSALPTFAFITPNDCDNKHGDSSNGKNQNCVTGSDALETRTDNWVKNIVPKLVNGGANVFITFDECACGGTKVGPMFAVDAGAGVTNGTSSSTADTHFGLLAGEEKSLGLALLGNAQTAPAVPIP